MLRLSILRVQVSLASLGIWFLQSLKLKVYRDGPKHLNLVLAALLMAIGLLWQLWVTTITHHTKQPGQI